MNRNHDFDRDELVMYPSDMAKKAEQLYATALFGSDGAAEGETATVGPIAKQHYLLALEALKQAEHHFKLSRLWLDKGQ